MPGEPHDQRGDVVTFGVDSGATRTRLVVGGEQVLRDDLTSLNPVSEANQTLAWLALLDAIPRRSHDELVGCVATASMSLANTTHEADTLRRAATESAVRGEVLLINDAAALLFAPPLHGFGIVVSVGTGTAFWCRDHDKQVYAASGYEYILSDEGGGFDIGRKGLQAAARAYDGRAEPTLLLDAAVERYGEDIPALGRHLATSAALKREVGAFAVNVCQLASIDPVADAILERACRSILLGVRAMLRHARDSACPVALTGSLLTQQSRFRDLVWAVLANECRSCHLYDVPCAATSALWLAEHLEQVRDALTAPIAAEIVVL